MDVLNYTNDEIVKNLILTETHLKQATSGVDEQFCQECLDKHFYTISGLADEGLSFTENPKQLCLFAETKVIADDYRGGDYKNSGIIMAQRMRSLRKKFTNTDCPECDMKFSNPGKIINLAKSLNTNSTSKKTVEGRPHTQYSFSKINKNKNRGENTMKTKEVIAIGAGQAVAEAVRYGVETYKPEWLQYIGAAGGAVLTGASLYLLKKKPKLQALGVIAGTNLLLAGVAAYVRGAVEPVPAARLGVRAARLPVIPTRRARGAILASPAARAYEAPAQAGLIRVD